MHGGELSILWAWPKHFVGVVSCLSAIRRQFCIEKSRWEFEPGFCPLSGIKKRPLLGGCFSITTMLISIRNTELVRCREVVRFSGGPLSEARLYIRDHFIAHELMDKYDVINSYFPPRIYIIYYNIL